MDANLGKLGVEVEREATSLLLQGQQLPHSLVFLAEAPKADIQSAELLRTRHLGMRGRGILEPAFEANFAPELHAMTLFGIELQLEARSLTQSFEVGMSGGASAAVELPDSAIKR